MDVKLVVIAGSSKLQVVRLRSEETIVGRQRGCDVRVPSADVSRRHCRLSYRDGVLVLEDLASANGTFLNGDRVTGQAAVRPGDKVRLGPVVFRIEYQVAAVGGPAPAPLEEAELEPVEGPQEIELVALEEEPAPEPLPKKKRPRKGAKEQETVPLSDKGEEEATLNLDDIAWRPPENADLRDILSKLGGQ